MKLFKLHLTLLIVVGLPSLLVPLALWAPVDGLPDIVGIGAILYFILWAFYIFLTSLLMSGLLLFVRGRTTQAVISSHIIIFIALLAYALFLLSH